MIGLVWQSDKASGKNARWTRLEWCWTMPNMPLRQPPPPPLPEDAGRLVIPPPARIPVLYTTPHELSDKVEDGNNTAFHAADPDILDPF